MKREDIASVELYNDDFIKIDGRNGLPIDNRIWHYTKIVNKVNDFSIGDELNPHEEFIQVTRLPREIQWELKKAILTILKKGNE